MKTKLSFLFTAMFISTISIWAQKMYKSNAHAPFYLQALTPEEKPIKRNIQQVFSTHQSVDVIDFSETVITLPPAFYRQSIQTRLKKAEFFGITNRAVMQTIVQQQPEALTLVMPFNKSEITVDLVKANIFGDGFKITTNDNTTSEAVTLGAYYRGVVRGENSIVSLSFFPSHVEGLIIRSGKSTIELGKMKNSSTDNVHIIYLEEDQLQKQPFVCGTPPPIPEQLEKIKSIRQMSLAEASTTLKCVTNFWETRFDLYNYLGNNLQAVNDLVTTLFNSYTTIYANESIGMKLNGTKIWTSADPYVVSTDNYAVLNDFSNKRRSFGANLAMLISSTGGGGIAWINTLCHPTDLYKHSFCGSVTSAGYPYPSWSWPVEVTTHEVGHNLGSPHTHDCAWNGNNTAIDGCGPTAGYPGNGSCPVGPIPAKGTIMSYCHLLQNVGIDFQLGFGPQPGNLIRGVVNSCITLTCDINSVPTITASGPTSNLCPGTSVTLTCSPASSYLWSTGATTQSIVVTAAGSYTVTANGATSAPTVVSYLVCGKPTSLATSNLTSTSVTFNWAAVKCAVSYTVRYRKVNTTTWTKKAVTTNTVNITGLTRGTTYQWQVQTICVKTPKTASTFAMGTNFTTTSSLIASANENSLNIKTDNGNFNAIVYPNPANNKATLTINGAVKGANVRITDMAGRVLWQTFNVKGTKINLPVEKFSAGIYFVTITNGHNSKVIKVVKE